MNQRQRGSTLILVILIATALSVGVFSALDIANSEFKKNKRAAIYTEAKHAAEAIMQAATADLRVRFERSTAFAVDSLSPSKNPLEIPSDFTTLFAAAEDSYLVQPDKTRYDSTDDYNTQPTEIIGGQVPPGQWRFIDRRIPGNEFDELAGMRVFERNVEMLSKATVERPGAGDTTVYARQFMEVRDAPLLAYAIFYNLPMEIAPGPKMEVYGNVHVNEDSWVQANSGLEFHSKVTTAGLLHHGRHPDSGKGSSNGSVYFPNGSEDLVNMKEDGTWPDEQRDAFSGGFLTSAADNFYDLSNQLYEGNLQTANHGVLPQKPVGVMEYIEDTDTSTSAKEALNSAYAMIQPVLNKNELTIPSEATDPEGHLAQEARNEVEQQKYAYKAGLVIKVANDGTTQYLTHERDSEGDLKYQPDGSPEMRSLSPSDTIAQYEVFAESPGAVTSGLHDKRQAADLNIVEIDVEKLKDLVHANDETKWGGAAYQKPEAWWNGVVYVEFEQQYTTSTRDDYVNPAVKGYGVKLKNGGVIPNPSFGHSKDIYGTTVATNQMLYVQGHYNADGDMGTGSPTEPDDPANFAKEGHEAPAALIADSITFLSQNWDDADSILGLGTRKAADTEVSAGVVTGLVPSGKTGSNRYSGGVENFPRFLEHWKHRDLRIRGSMVALFESEVGTRGWGYGNVYQAPNREWGFHSKFAEGYLPPGTPNTRRYRVVDFELVDATTYEEHVERLKTLF